MHHCTLSHRRATVLQVEGVLYTPNKWSTFFGLSSASNEDETGPQYYSIRYSFRPGAQFTRLDITFEYSFLQTEKSLTRN